MYVTNRRQREYIHVTGFGSGSSGVIDIDYRVPQLVEGVYSWRTGARAISDPPASPSFAKESRTDGWGITTPSNSGSLVSRLADRKRYMQEMQMAAFPAETQTGSVSVDRTSTTDSGHVFGKHQTFRVPYLVSLDYYSTASRWYKGDIWGDVGWGLVNPSPFPFYVRDQASPLVVASTNRQAMANRYFASTAPDRNDANVATTLIELLRGDLPSVLRNFQEMMAGYRSVRNFLGSDYLNITFGWTPLIQEYANLIKVGMNLERVIYYESFRRKRQWDGPTWQQKIAGSVSINCANNAFNAGGLLADGGKIGYSSGVGLSFDSQADHVASEDYHFASRYTGLAKASRRANSFSDQAMDVVKRLGLVDDPRLLWDLTPYSWLVDWFTSMGDSVANAAVYSPHKGKYSVDYAYLTTQHLVKSEGRILRPTTTPSSAYRSFRVKQATSVAISQTRWRDRATPFGFGTQLGSLSASQYAILVALGLARSR